MKTFELTIEERDALCDALHYCSETNANCNLKEDGTWEPPETEAEYHAMKALREKLMPKKVQKSGWVLKNTLVAVWQNRPIGEEDQFQHITWEEME